MARLRMILRLAFLAVIPMLFSSCEKEEDSTSGDSYRYYALNVYPNRAMYGTVDGAGVYMQGDTVVVEAEPFVGYYFIRWSDGDASNPRTIVVEGDLTLYALFSDRADDPNPYNPIGGSGDNPDPEPLQTEGWVDLGLPSGLLWAACNVGASSPEDYGDYVAWGETQSKDIYNWSTYQYGSDYNKLTKYCYNANYGLDGYTDNLRTLEPGDDAAMVRQGGGARTPTQSDWQELMANTTCKWTVWNGVYGCRFTAANGNAIFLPAAGYRSYTVTLDAGSYGDYWSSTLGTDNPGNAWKFFCGSNRLNMNAVSRSYGFSVRAVRAAN